MLIDTIVPSKKSAQKKKTAKKTEKKVVKIDTVPEIIPEVNYAVIKVAETLKDVLGGESKDYFAFI
jgi:hypothetical protein